LFIRFFSSFAPFHQIRWIRPRSFPYPVDQDVLRRFDCSLRIGSFFQSILPFNIAFLFIRLNKIVSTFSFELHTRA